MTSKQAAAATNEMQVTYRKYDPRNPENRFPAHLQVQMEGWSRDKLEFEFKKQVIRACKKRSELTSIEDELEEERHAKLELACEALTKLKKKLALLELELEVMKFQLKNKHWKLDKTASALQGSGIQLTPKRWPGEKIEAPGAPKKAPKVGPSSKEASLYFDSD